MTDSTPVSVDPAVLELYKLTVEMADRVSSRRSTANAFFLTVHTALTTVVGVITTDVSTLKASSWVAAHAAVLASATAGVVLSTAWFILLRSYRDLNSAKFAVINQIEEDYLPVRPFADEWKILKKDPVKAWRERYAELGFVERAIPVTFAAVYSSLALATVLG
jgi:hypothetical protein